MEREGGMEAVLEKGPGNHSHMTAQPHLFTDPSGESQHVVQ